ncbi:MAG: response regulator [Desulfobulbus sp.]|jgi:DNA-binding response OmpR family regulator|uniref:response regulator n=1 Tax=Desulfobulbus sp. TaxID=895 RepID=UPI002851DDB2|nr:response regulator [Desulfobulbus sp.]MDR2551147.1 response regulator [Desulfobulbus sp.]
MRVLLVDDEEELVATLAERLDMRGIDAAWASDYRSALGLVEVREFDIALLDVRLPEMSGLELKRLIEARRPDMKFIFLTGHGSEEDFEACSAESGKEYYLIKPVQIEVLVAKLNEICQGQGERG